MRRVVLVTGHYALSKRRAGFHWLADALWRDGWDVTFLTCSFSHLHRLKRDHRFSYGLLGQAGRPVRIRERLTSYVWFTAWHPPNKIPTFVDRALDPLFRGYGRLQMPLADGFIRAADLFIFESTAGIMLVDRFKELNPTARYVYRMSEDFELLRAPRSVLRAEAASLSTFDLVSVTSEYSLRKVAHLSNAELRFHGIEKALFDEATADPYPGGPTANALWVGVARLDLDFLAAAAEAFPAIAFHVIGPAHRLPERSNIVAYGELPFGETVPYVQHADIGLQAIQPMPGGEHLADSLKVIQFTYCRKPIVAPAFLSSSRSNVFAYEPGDVVSIRAAIDAARTYDARADSRLGRERIQSWDEIARGLVGEVG